MSAGVDEQPVVCVEHGQPTDEELAALIAAVLTCAAAARADQPAPHATTAPVAPPWNRPGHKVPYRSPVSWQR
jgi:Acyl-CoA carboxylase epsilon subunit